MTDSVETEPGTTRRTFIKRSAGTAAGLAVGTGLMGEAVALAGKRAPSPLLQAKPGRLASTKTMWKWNEYLAGLGARHTGSPSEVRFTHDIRQAMKRLGWKTSVKPQTFDNWEANSYSLTVTPAGGSARKVRVGYYYPYSGRTGRSGITGELAYAGSGRSAADFAGGSFAGKIAVIDVPPFSVPVGVAFNAWDRKFAADVDITKPYDRSWVATGPPLKAAKEAGAIGAIIILPEAPADGKGQYSPFGLELQGLPALNVDAPTGDMLRSLAQTPGNKAKMTLTATRSKGKTRALMAVLPGASDEVVVVNTHTDGTNLIEENGPLAMISLAQRLSAIPKADRPVTFAFYFATGHFQADVVSAPAYITDYPKLFERTKAGLTIEHLGCPEYETDHKNVFKKTGKPEISGLFSSNRTLANMARPVIEAKGVARCTVMQPTPVFFGEGRDLHAEGIPMLAYIAGPHYLLAERSKKVQLERFNVNRMQAETRAFAAMLDKLAVMPRTS